MDTLLFASLMGLYYWFARLRLGYTFSAMLLQPVVIAVFVGLLLGNMQTAMIIGAGMQLVYSVRGKWQRDGRYYPADSLPGDHPGDQLRHGPQGIYAGA